MGLHVPGEFIPLFQKNGFIPCFALRLRLERRSVEKIKERPEGSGGGRRLRHLRQRDKKLQVGMRSEWTLSGKEAVLRAGQSMKLNDPFRAYIIDWRLPDMNGIEVARQIRSLGDDTPIILTAYDWTDIEAEARAAGVTAFCAKPIRIEEVLLTLQGVFHQGSIRYREKTLLPFRTLRGEVGAFASYGVFA